MTDTIREQILQALTLRAQPLSTLPVERCLRSINDIDKDKTLRFVTLWDGEGILKESGYDYDTRELPVAVECVFTVPDKTNPSVLANTVMGEITKALFDGGGKLGGLADSMVQQSENPTYQQDGSNKTYVQVVFVVTYSTKKNDPFTSANTR